MFIIFCPRRVFSHAHLPGLSFASLCPAPFKKQRQRLERLFHCPAFYNLQPISHTLLLFQTASHGLRYLPPSRGNRWPSAKFRWTKNFVFGPAVTPEHLYPSTVFPFLPSYIQSIRPSRAPRRLTNRDRLPYDMQERGDRFCSLGTCKKVSFDPRPRDPGER